MNNPIYIYVHAFLLKKLERKFAIIIMDVNNVNLIGTLEELTRIINYLIKEFEMIDFEEKNLSQIINQVFSN